MVSVNRLSEKKQDFETWDSFLRGDQKAFEQLYQRYFKSMAHYGMKLLKDRHLVEDAIQDVFIDLWRRREYLSEAHQPKFYLFRALRNQVLRNARNDIFEESEDIDDFLDYLGTLSVEQQTIEKETLTEKAGKIKDAIARLSPRQREAIMLRFYHGFSLEETSSLMKLSKQAVSNLFYRSYTVLRMLIEPYAVIIISCFLQ